MKTLEMHEPFCKCKECVEKRQTELPFKLLAMESIPPGDNPFLHDLYNMGTQVAKNVIIMHPSHQHERTSYIIVVNTETGERLRIEFN